MTRTRSGPAFEGFQGPNYTMVPNELFDELMADLSGAELKALLYVVRRTFGFKKDADAISLSQMLRGIRTRDGRVLDRGVGLAKNTLLAALASLEAKRVILIERRQSVERGNEPNVYRLNVVGAYPGPIAQPPQAQKEDQGPNRAPAPSAQKGDKGVGARTALPPAQGVSQGGGSAGDPGPWRKNRYPQQKEEQETSRQGERRQDKAEQWKAPSKRSTVRTPRTPDASQEEPEAAPARTRRVYDPDRRQILEYMADFARELNDQASLVSTTSRAVNIFRRAGVPIEEFAEALYDARAITKERTASIRAEAPDARTKRAVKPRMPFFFAVLEDLLGLRPEDDGGPGGPDDGATAGEDEDVEEAAAAIQEEATTADQSERVGAQRSRHGPLDEVAARRAVVDGARDEAATGTAPNGRTHAEPATVTGSAAAREGAAAPPAAPTGGELGDVDAPTGAVRAGPSPDQVWQAALGELAAVMTSASFETWVKNARARAYRRGTFTIAAPHRFAKEWLETRYREQIEAVLGRILGRPTELAVVVEGFGQAAPPVSARPRRRQRQRAAADGETGPPA